VRAAYAEHPEQALIHKHVRTEQRGDTDPFHGTVVPGDEYGVSWRFGIDRAVGGFHDGPNPGEILCAALAACLDSTVRMVADLMGVAIERLEVEVHGHVDVRGALVIDAAVPVGFQSLECKVHLQPAAGTRPELVKKVTEASERLCINLATLRGGVRVDTTFNVGASHQPAAVATSG
jgi:uncharacterized OsmC-like protein